MPQDHIRYDILAQDALRGVIRKVLSEVAATGYLPGEHHFFITFMTEAPGVRISTQLKERYPEQMTIVVQHQFWDLKVSEAQFEIGLSFSDKPEKLIVPFAAVRGFYDPSVNFELEFDTVFEEAANDGETVEASDEDLAEAIERIIEPEAGADASQPGAGGANAADASEKNGADVVSLDSFRKKS
ncbi:SspB family protein [Pseudohoeflea coraliihabitans]|uniref:SspB family protein n=1 Tax=Pseudohoeflea coraliihabitans TaxID=2860393 RepID=A0ABS6WIX0_9HYPH|nr:SspB family protein [Pseudohoeflea sp. DP4N28-3]MBW3095888.1 SspB family protein [Pseudohoeflea sp. DP4N28-3]